MKHLIPMLCFAIFSMMARVEGQQLPAETDTTLPGTQPLTWEVHLADSMMDGAHQLIERKIQEAQTNRSRVWNRDFSSEEAYNQSIHPNRRRFMKYIGLKDTVDPYNKYNVAMKNPSPDVSMEKYASTNDPLVVAETSQYRVYQVRWPVMNGVHGAGLLLEPKTDPVANIVALPDADQTPEQLLGLAQGIPERSQFARRLAEHGFRVLVPVLINRKQFETERGTRQTHREWVFRQAFHMGRHVIGYEVQKVMAAIDWFEKMDGQDVKTGVAGYCEGGLIAFYSAAVDTRIDAAFVSGYFDDRQKVWDEPIYRNVWGLLTEFGDAEIASLIAPRSLVIERSAIPKEVEESTARPENLDMTTYTGYKGSLTTPGFAKVQAEFNRIDDLVEPGFQSRTLFAGQENQPVNMGSQEALEKFVRELGYEGALPISNNIPEDNRSGFEPEARQLEQVKEIEGHVQQLLRVSDQIRNDFFLYDIMSEEFTGKSWTTKRYHRYDDPGRFIEESKEYRQYFWEEILGKFEEPLLPANPRTRQVYDRPRWKGYEVVLDVYKGFTASGTMLIPKDMETGEKRPVVVVQHGRNGTPEITIEGSTSYYDISARLANQGFIVLATQGLFRGEDRYRFLDRKANALKKTLFSFITAQHQQILNWLGALPYVDAERIAFYGKSFGGETALRVPSVLPGYCLSICSGFFTDEARKVADTHDWHSFMNTIEWEIPYFNMGSTFSAAEMAYLIFPRPFMVERGRFDAVSPDRWVGYEYAKVAHLYEQFGLGEKTTIEYFNGGHASRNDGTFEFFHRHLEWP